MATSTKIDLTCKIVKKYYSSFGVDYDAIFSTWCDDNGFDDDAVEEEFNAFDENDPTDWMLADFDENDTFPFKDKPNDEADKCRSLYKLLKMFWDNFDNPNVSSNFSPQNPQYNINTPSTTIKRYTYLPSISNGIFGTWFYNDSSPHIIASTSSNDDDDDDDDDDAEHWFRKREPIDYKFEIVGPRNEPIANGKKYNVKLLQEYKLPVGKCIKNMLKKSGKQPPKKTNSGTLFICEGSVVSFSGECIINAANEAMLGGAGVDGAISSAGGDSLYHLRQLVPTIKGSKYVRCKTGNAKITQSGFPYNRLKCDYVIHAVGPNYSMMYRGGKNMKIKDIDNLLYLSYAKSMLICKEKGIKTVGFCLISSGIFRGPKSLDDVLKIGIEAIRDYMFDGIEVFMIGYQNSELVCLSKVAPKVLGKMHKQYAKVKERKANKWGSWNFD